MASCWDRLRRTIPSPVPAADSRLRAFPDKRFKLSQSVRITNITSGKVKGKRARRIGPVPKSELRLGLHSPGPPFTGPDPTNAGKAITVRISASKLPEGITPGNYYVVAEVTDPAGGAATAISATTIAVAAPQIDLSGSFKQPPTSARSGHPLSATIVVNNVGNVAAAGVLPIAVYVSGDGTLDGTSTGLVGLNYRINIKSGKSMTFHLNKAIAPAAGSYFLVIVLDPNNTLGDVNTANNTFVTTRRSLR